MTKQHIKSTFSVFAVFVLALALTLQAFFVPNVSADQILNRKLTLQAGATDGGSKPSGNVRHFYEFNVPSSTAIGSIRFSYCTTAADVGTSTCAQPTGLTSTAAALGSEAGSDASGFTLNATTNGVLLLTKATAAAPSGSRDLKFRFDGVVNPGPAPQTFFVRIQTFNSTDGTGTAIDSGTVNAATTNQIILNGTMPESLVFCTGATIGKTLTVPDCSTAGTGSINFNQLFSPTDTASAVSQMAASTNAGFGYIITVNGPTLTSGSNTIAGLASPTGSTKGAPQFGLNLVENTSAAAPGFDPLNPDPLLVTLSAPIDQVSDGVNLNGRPTADYATADNFKFVSGEAVADSNFLGAANGKASDAQIYTVSYIANVPGSQPAGTYASTLTYICTPTF